MVTVVIPTLNEERMLPSCLDAVVPQATATGTEVLVVDGGSTDGTVRAATARGVRVLHAEVGRGRQMNHGARRARGTLLLFLPADTLLPPGALDRLGAVDRRGSPVAGCFRQSFDRRRPVLRLVSALHNLRVRVTGIPYGDQAPFVRRELFHALGGFREDIDMEDVELGARLRRRARPRVLDLTVCTSARRFDRAGDLRAIAAASGLLASWTLLRRVGRSRTFFTPVR